MCDKGTRKLSYVSNLLVFLMGISIIYVFAAIYLKGSSIDIEPWQNLFPKSKSSLWSKFLANLLKPY